MNRIKKIKIWDKDSQKMIEYQECYILLYTGYKDKNNNDIYEGDIVIHNCDPDGTPYYGVFKYNKINNQIELLVIENGGYWEELDETLSNLEIIGNKFDNFELIKESLKRENLLEEVEKNE